MIKEAGLSQVQTLLSAICAKLCYPECQGPAKRADTAKSERKPQKLFRQRAAYAACSELHTPIKGVKDVKGMVELMQLVGSAQLFLRPRGSLRPMLHSRTVQSLEGGSVRRITSR